MRKIEEKVEAAWQRSRGEDVYNPYYPVKASSNFADGYKAGAAEALSHQWVSVEDELPDSYGPVLLFCEFGAEIGYYEHGEWYLNGYGTINSVTFWMPIPPLPEARKESI